MGKSKSKILADGNENTEESTNSSLSRLENFMNQITSYQRNCINEFGDQVRQLMEFVIQYSTANFTEISLQFTDSMTQQNGEYKTSLKNSQDMFDSHKKMYDAKLFPILGHPAQRGKMEQLVQDQEIVQKTIHADFKSLVKDFKKSYALTTVHFVEEFLSLVSFYFKIFDDILTEDEIIFDDLPPEPKPIEALLFMGARVDNSETSSTDCTNYGHNQIETRKRLKKMLKKLRELMDTKSETKIWQNILTMFDSDDCSNKTLVHRKVREMKHRVVESAGMVDDCLKEVEDATERWTVVKERWDSYWGMCIERIKELYTQ